MNVVLVLTHLISLFLSSYSCSLWWILWWFHKEVFLCYSSSPFWQTAAIQGAPEVSGILLALSGPRQHLPISFAPPRRPWKAKGQAAVQDQAPRPTGAQDAVAVDQWGVSWTQPRPPTQGKRCCTCRCNDRRSRCSFIRTRMSFLCLCVRDQPCSLLWLSTQAFSPGSARNHLKTCLQSQQC